MLGACTPKQSRRFFYQEAAAFCCIGFPFGGSCQWPRPLTDEGLSLIHISSGSLFAQKHLWNGVMFVIKIVLGVMGLMPRTKAS